MSNWKQIITGRKGAGPFARGEELIAWAGASVGAIVLGVVVFTGWWSSGEERAAAERDRTAQIKVVTDLLAGSLEPLLGGNDVSAARRLVVDTARSHELSVCRLKLPDGRTVADGEPLKIDCAVLPEKWSAGLDAKSSRADDSEPQPAGNEQVESRVLRVSGRGPLFLEVRGKTLESAGIWKSATGYGLAGAAGLAGLLIVYRRLRSRVRTLTLIRESLLAAGAGQTDTAALALAADLGPEAAAWNKVLDDGRRNQQAGVGERAKAALGLRRESNGDLDSVVDSLHIGVVVVDAAGNVRAANGAASVVMHTPDAAVGQPVADVVSIPVIQEAVNLVLRGDGSRKSFEVDRTEKGGGVLRVQVRPLRKEDGGGALVTVEDVTQQRVADASRNSFVAQATHELRAPLTNMRLALECLLEDEETVNDPAAVAIQLNLINTETRRLERLVGEMLSVAEIEAGSLQLRLDDVRFDKLFDELKHDYSKQAEEKKLGLIFDMPPKLPVISGDREKLAAALHNLISNALKYTPSGGRITVAAREEGKNLIVDIIDTGFGISESDRPKIFQKFYRAKDPRVSKITGTGLGLALAKEVARLHGGDLSFASELNKGTTFSMSVPVKKAA